MTHSGTVYLVGAGPGDPLLISCRGLQVLARADVVLYDYLVNPELLRHVRAGAQQICLGRHGRGSLWSPGEIHERLIAEALEGRQVVRLKSGDSLVFGRAAKEIDGLTRAGIPFEIVPGITAAMAAASYAGIPLTDRERASAVAFVTGQEMDGKARTSLDYRELARFPGTLVIYMGVTTAPRWTGQLMEAGMPADRPVALIRRCSWPNQQIIRCRLDEVADRVTPYAKFPPPAIAIIGSVAQSIPRRNWFEQRALFGETVVVTRPADQAGDLKQRLVELGAEVLVQPTIEIADPADDWKSVDAAIDQLDVYDDIVFSSANGVDRFLQRLFDVGFDARRLAGKRLATIGPGTSQALARFQLHADIQPTSDFRAEALVEALRSTAAGRHMLVLRASRGRDALALGLENAGATISQVVAYESRDIEILDDFVAESIAKSQRVWITATSSTIARAAVHLLRDPFGDRANWVSISPLTTQALHKAGIPVVTEALEASVDGLVEAIVRQKNNVSNPDPCRND